MADIAGLILAGGRSRRFGTEKAVAELDDESLIERVLAVLARSCSPIAIAAPTASAAATLARTKGLEVIADSAGIGEGPLAGLMAGLDWAARIGASRLASAPCDTPFLPATLVERLAAAAGDGAGVARSPSGLQSLCALWPIARTRTALRATAVGGRHPPVRRLLAELGAVEVAFSDEAGFANVNTREDLDLARQAARTRT